MMSISRRELMLLTGAVFSWALLGSLYYGLQAGRFEQKLWAEWFLGGQLRWLPWIGFAVMIVELNKRTIGLSLKRQAILNLGLGSSIVLIHALYLRFIRPIPPMLLDGRSYMETLVRFNLSDYLRFQSVFMDLAVYLAIAVPTIVIYRLNTDRRRVSTAESTAVDLAGDLPDNGSNCIDRLVIRSADKSIVVPIGEIDSIEAEDYYVLVRYRGQRLLHRQSIQSLERLLPTSLFVRVHRSALVNIRHVVEMVAIAESRWAVRLKSGELVEVSRRRRRDVEKRLRQTN